MGQVWHVVVVFFFSYRGFCSAVGILFYCLIQPRAVMDVPAFLVSEKRGRTACVEERALSSICEPACADLNLADFHWLSGKGPVWRLG